MTNNKVYDIIIVGAGVIGLLTAREWVRKGANVLILEKGLVGSEASWAGGGIVSPLYPWRYSPAVSALSYWAHEAYPELSRQLAEETGIDPEFNPSGLLMVCVEDEQEALEWSKAEDRNIQWQDRESLYQLEKNLAPGFEGALWMPDVGNIRNPRLLKALHQYLKQSGQVDIVEHCEVSGFKCKHSRVLAVQTRLGEYSADQYVVSTGAWSGKLLKTSGMDLPIEPVRGQMLVFKSQPGLLKHIVLCDGRYVIPRRDGRILVGSTLEHVGFDKSTTDSARTLLQKAAVRMVPALGELPVEKHWAGLRPGSPDGVPIISQAEEIENLFINAGHYRNGLVLAPASVRLLMDLMLGRTPFINPEPYQCVAH